MPTAENKSVLIFVWVNQVNSHLSNVNFAILIVVVGLHEAGFEFRQHGIRYSFGVNVRRIGTRDEFAQESIELCAFDVAITWKQ